MCMHVCVCVCGYVCVCVWNKEKLVITVSNGNKFRPAGQLKEAFPLLQRKQTGILIFNYIYRFMKNNIDDWWYNLWLIYNILLSFPLDCHRKNYYRQKSLQHSRGPSSWNSIETTSFGLVISVPKQRESSRLCFGFLSLLFSYYLWLFSRVVAKFCLLIWIL